MSPKLFIGRGETYSSLVPHSALFNTGRGEKSRSTWLASADPTKTGYGITHRGADPALVQRLGQGACERDEQHTNRLTASLKGTWSVAHRSGLQMEKATFTGHPAEPMEEDK